MTDSQSFRETSNLMKNGNMDVHRSVLHSVLERFGWALLLALTRKDFAVKHYSTQHRGDQLFRPICAFPCLRKIQVYVYKVDVRT